MDKHFLQLDKFINKFLLLVQITKSNSLQALIRYFPKISCIKRDPTES